MTEPDRILHLVNNAIRAHHVGGQAGLEEYLAQLGDADLEAMITSFAEHLGAHARFHTGQRHGDGGRA